jgi:hypothetical protein
MKKKLINSKDENSENLKKGFTLETYKVLG